ncbi:hypothetical protein AB0C70_42560 [Streptomyces sp. NPDC048564]|uniref:hypothetical protein n=1 Tax=Streptomyces sp. NPDC048564 TaxID=3155760 RepID=UPI00343AF920
MLIRITSVRLAEAVRAAEEAADFRAARSPEHQLREADARVAEARRLVQEVADLRALRELRGLGQDRDVVQEEFIRSLGEATDRVGDVVSAARREFRAAQEAAGHGARDEPLDSVLEQGTPDSDETWWVIDEPLSTEDEQRVAEQTADSINRTLARLLVRLGPPPAGAGGVATPVTSGDGGSAR